MVFGAVFNDITAKPTAHKRLIMKIKAQRLCCADFGQKVTKWF